MTYHIEPVEDTGERVRIDWLIELEVGAGLARNVATITDLTECKISVPPRVPLQLGWWPMSYWPHLYFLRATRPRRAMAFCDLPTPECEA